MSKQNTVDNDMWIGVIEAVVSANAIRLIASNA